jgi:hypothetical protein
VKQKRPTDAMKNTEFVDRLEGARKTGQETKRLIDQTKKAMENLQSAVRMANVIISGNHAPVTISELVVQSGDRVSDSDPCPGAANLSWRHLSLLRARILLRGKS